MSCNHELVQTGGKYHWWWNKDGEKKIGRHCIKCTYQEDQIIGHIALSDGQTYLTKEQVAEENEKIKIQQPQPGVQ